MREGRKEGGTGTQDILTHKTRDDEIRNCNLKWAEDCYSNSLTEACRTQALEEEGLMKKEGGPELDAGGGMVGEGGFDEGPVEEDHRDEDI